MIITHEIKLLETFADAVLDGRKNFEVRENDRGYQRGDTVKFIVVDKAGKRVEHPLETEEFVITYVLSGWEIKDGYVVFGIRNISGK